MPKMVTDYKLKNLIVFVGAGAEEEESRRSSGDQSSEGAEEEEKQAPPQKLDGEPDTSVREPTDGELYKALEKVPLPQGHKETGRITFNISAEEFFTLFHAENAEYTFERYFVYRGYKKIEVSQ